MLAQHSLSWHIRGAAPELVAQEAERPRGMRGSQARGMRVARGGNERRAWSTASFTISGMLSGETQSRELLQRPAGCWADARLTGV